MVVKERQNCGHILGVSASKMNSHRFPIETPVYHRTELRCALKFLLSFIFLLFQVHMDIALSLSIITEVNLIIIWHDIIYDRTTNTEKNKYARVCHEPEKRTLHA